MNHKMINRGQRIIALAFVLVMVWLITAAYSNESATDSKTNTATPMGLIPFELGKSIPVSVSAKVDVTSFDLFHLNKIEFRLSEKSILTAKVRTSYTTGLAELPAITYTVHAAIFDADRKLLGTANNSQKIATWGSVGFVARTKGEFALGFGSSLNYNKAKYFTLAISEPEIKVASQPGKDTVPAKQP